MRAYCFFSVLLFFCLSLPIKTVALALRDSQHEDPQHAGHPAGHQNPPPEPQSQDSMQDMPGMQHGTMHMQPENFIDEILHHQTAGTSAETGIPLWSRCS